MEISEEFDVEFEGQIHHFVQIVHVDEQGFFRTPYRGPDAAREGYHEAVARGLFEREVLILGFFN